MLWLIWQMGLLLLLAVGLGVLVGYRIWGGAERAAELNGALEDNARLRRVNENLARRLGERGEGAAPGAAQAEAPAEPAAEAPAEPAVVSPFNPVTPEADETDHVSDTPAPQAAAAKSPSGDDDLTRIKGLGPKAAAALNAGGITSLAQVAAWSESDIETWDARIGGRGRIVRDNWVGQAREMISA